MVYITSPSAPQDKKRRMNNFLHQHGLPIRANTHRGLEPTWNRKDGVNRGGLEELEPREQKRAPFLQTAVPGDP
jgi:hypothetical protein